MAKRHTQTTFHFTVLTFEILLKPYEFKICNVCAFCWKFWSFVLFRLDSFHSYHVLSANVALQIQVCIFKTLLLEMSDFPKDFPNYFSQWASNVQYWFLSVWVFFFFTQNLKLISLNGNLFSKISKSSHPGTFKTFSKDFHHCCSQQCVLRIFKSEDNSEKCDFYHQKM